MNKPAEHRPFLHHFRSYVFRGFLAIIPIAISILAIRFLYFFIDQRIMGMVNERLGFSVPGLGILLLVISLYLLGLIASNVLGRQVLHFIEKIFDRIPIVKTIYQAGKQLAMTLSLPNRQVVKKVVLVNFPKDGVWSIGFVMGTVLDRQSYGKDENLLKVLVPLAPNPASGYVIFVRETETRDPGWTVEEAVRLVISDGIIGPDELRDAITGNDSPPKGEI